MRSGSRYPALTPAFWRVKIKNLDLDDSQRTWTCTITDWVMCFWSMSFAVYEQYARPKSRRSEPMEIIERPKTSRGRRSHCADISLEESERPVSRRGHHFGVEGAERPLTRHGRTSASDENPGPRSERETQPNYGDSMRARHGRTSTEPGGVLVMGDNTKGDVLTLDRGFQPTPPPPRTSMRARPKSAKGRMRPQAVVTNTGMSFCSGLKILPHCSFWRKRVLNASVVLFCGHLLRSCFFRSRGTITVVCPKAATVSRKLIKLRVVPFQERRLFWSTLHPHD